MNSKIGAYVFSPEYFTLFFVPMGIFKLSPIKSKLQKRCKGNKAAMAW